MSKERLKRPARNPRNRACFVKQSWWTLGAAQAVANSLASRGLGGNPMTAYQCPDCKNYHIGHTTRWNLKGD